MLRAREEDNRIAGNMDELEGEDYQNFPDEYKELMKVKLTWQHLKPMSKWLFWIDDDNTSESPPTQYRCAIPSPAPETQMANWRITMKLHSVIRKLLMEINEPSLVQLWVPRAVGDRILLTTAEQPFGFTLAHKRFCELRMKLMKLKLFVDGEGADNPGVIGHVFEQHMVASTPNVKYYTSAEYPQREDAIHADILSNVAYPVIEPSQKCCIAVLEVLSSSSNIPTSAVIRAIQDVGLRSSSIHGHDFIPEDLERHKKVVDEMERGVKAVCETHRLPLCQTWFRCMCCVDVESCASCVIFSSGNSDGSFALDDCGKDFLSACSADPLLPILLKGQGVAGKALSSYTQCFCRDVTGFTIDEYPLVHLARISWLAGSFAICLRSTYTGDADYVLEFFLPRKRNDWDPRPMLCSLLETMKQQFPSFKVASGKALGEELPVEYVDFSKGKKGSGPFQIVSFSSEQGLQLTGEHSADEGNVVGQERSNVIGSTIPSVNQVGEIVVTYEALEQHFGKKLDSVAESLGVSRSTLKRICRKHGIKRWPHHKRCKVSTRPEPSNGGGGGLVNEAQLVDGEEGFRQPEDSLSEETLAKSDVACTNHQICAPDTGLEEIAESMCPDKDRGAQMLTVKAAYREDTIRFPFSSTGGIIELKSQVAKRLGFTNFDIKGRDDDNEWVLITCDEDLTECLSFSMLSGNTCLRLSIDVQ